MVCPECGSDTFTTTSGTDCDRSAGRRTDTVLHRCVQCGQMWLSELSVSKCLAGVCPCGVDNP